MLLLDWLDTSRLVVESAGRLGTRTGIRKTQGRKWHAKTKDLWRHISGVKYPKYQLSDFEGIVNFDQSCLLNGDMKYWVEWVAQNEKCMLSRHGFGSIVRLATPVARPIFQSVRSSWEEIRKTPSFLVWRSQASGIDFRTFLFTF